MVKKIRLQNMFASSERSFHNFTFRSLFFYEGYPDPDCLKQQLVESSLELEMLIRSIDPLKIYNFL
jgi:hypothetical protein